jgi:Asp/Glu/hydantoin racemase
MTITTCARVLVFNPNTSISVTESFKPVLSSIDLPNMELIYWTCPTGPSLIKTQAHLFESASHCLPLLLEIANDFDGFLGACYADHPIVRLLQTYVGDKPVVGIFDASVLAASHLTASNSKFGIITTGSAFESLLADGVERLLAGTAHDRKHGSNRFAGAVASSIGADDVGPEARETARAKIMAATRQLVSPGDVDVLCVGGVILAGMEPWIREACELELGTERGREIKIIEQLTVGALLLNGLMKGQTCFDFTPALR